MRQQTALNEFVEAVQERWRNESHQYLTAWSRSEVLDHFTARVMKTNPICFTKAVRDPRYLNAEGAAKRPEPTPPPSRSVRESDTGGPVTRTSFIKRLVTMTNGQARKAAHAARSAGAIS